MKTDIRKQKPIICKRCGKKVGIVGLKWKWHIRLIGVAFLLAIVVEFIAEILVKQVLGY